MLEKDNVKLREARGQSQRREGGALKKDFTHVFT